jgi:hypothetical protein
MNIAQAGQDLALKFMPAGTAFVKKIASTSITKNPIAEGELWADAYDRNSKTRAGTGEPAMPNRVPLKAASNADGQMVFKFAAPGSSAPLSALFSKGWAQASCQKSASAKALPL